MMKNILLVAAALISSIAIAQSSSSTNVGSSSTTVDAVKPVKSKWGASFLSENNIGAKGLAEHGFASAPIMSASLFSVAYKVDAENSVSFGHNFAYYGNFQNLDPEMQGALTGKMQHAGYNMLDPHIAFTKKNAVKSILGSESVTAMIRYYAPVSERSSKMNRVGTVRFDSGLDWKLNPVWTASYAISPRFTLEKSIDAGVGIRMIQIASLSRSVRDNVDLYGALTVDTIAPSAQLNNTRVAMENATAEVGANIMVEKIMLNPSISEEMSTRETMSFGKYGQRSYNLIFQAAF